jgi:hypothetical protein
MFSQAKHGWEGLYMNLAARLMLTSFLLGRQRDSTENGGHERPTRDANDRSNEMTKAKRSTLSPKAPRKSAGNMASPKKTPTKSRAQAIERTINSANRRAYQLSRTAEVSDVESDEEQEDEDWQQEGAEDEQQQEHEQEQQKRSTRSEKRTVTKKRKLSATWIDRRASHGVRRILAERGSSNAKGQYLIDWLPSWEAKSYLPEEAEEIELWNKSKKDGYTFEFEGDTMYRCLNPTEDKDEAVVRTMADTVLHKFKTFMTSNHVELAQKLFANVDWIFAPPKEHEEHDQHEEALRLAEKYGLPPPSTAAEVMRQAYQQMRELRVTNPKSKKLAYRRVKVKYIGQVDPSVKTVEQDMRKPIKVTTAIAPLFHVNLRSMKPEAWETNEDLHKNLAQLSEMAHQFITVSPFMLSHPWPHMFTRLFHLSDDMRPELKKSHEIELTDDWNDHSRDFFLYTYMRKCDDQRAIDSVEQTYLTCRDMCRWHAKYSSEDKDRGDMCEKCKKCEKCSQQTKGGDVEAEKNDVEMEGDAA